MTNWILVDSSFLAHQARFSMGNLSHEETATGVLYGFLMRVLTLAERFESNNFIFCFDTDASKGVRRRDWPEYKLKRQQDRSEAELADIIRMHQQLDALRDNVLPSLGFKNLFWQQGFESDDVIAHIAKKVPLAKLGECAHLYIVSNDGDLAQLLVPAVSMYNPTTKKETTHVTFEAENGYPVGMVAPLKALAGCVSDNIKGISGVGEKTALKILSVTCPPELHAKAQKEKKKNDQRMKLVLLPHAEFKGDKIRIERDIFKPDVMKVFSRVCKQYGLESMTHDPLQSRFQAVFSGIFAPARAGVATKTPLGRINFGNPLKNGLIKQKKNEFEMGTLGL